jgi:hypothetical protein
MDGCADERRDRQRTKQGFLRDFFGDRIKYNLLFEIFLLL